MGKTAVLIVAAGRGTRFQDPRPKQYHALAGRPVLRRTLARFAGHPAVHRVQAVIRAQDRALYDAAAAGLALPEPVIGGAERQDSVRAGLDALVDFAPDFVLVHDGVRPFVDPALISRVIAALEDAPAAIPALPVTDTLKRAASDPNGRLRVGETLSRADLYTVQTPQGFRFADIRAAHAAASGGTLTDDAAVAEMHGLEVRLVPGAADNLKLTVPGDLARAGDLAGPARRIRIGTGFDAHRFAAQGDRVMLCGVAVPHTASLAGHSDADVGLHALTDALLGALGAADIGHHFPPSDPAYRGMDSARFLAHAVAILDGLGGHVENADVTLICERPKIGPYRAAMTSRTAELLGIDPGHTNIKATTTEGMGFTGRGEGMAAQAAVTIALP